MCGSLCLGIRAYRVGPVFDEWLLDYPWTLARILLPNSLQHSIGQIGQNRNDLKALGLCDLCIPRSGDLTC